ncbi:sterol desaturase family protein [Aquirufa ecclesiirivi]|uniref:Sterol desaturase family protein n=1 Tax=Aquirufa ecclesiirivi TaxID=2715124 RepID=A0ABT4JEK5_9BACT|nr:sterol desaturase family protein [Aquirufa ecclesiirivi]MCZ2474695.1 sterol desaturase family protein [Aquirufa ecclesiirivi]
MKLHDVHIICFIVLIVGVILLIWFERKYPYRKGISFFREGFWTDLLAYAIVQSFLLKILIFDYIIAPIQLFIPIKYMISVGSWPIACQLLFFLITHDLYIYWFHRWQHANKILWRTHEAHHSNQKIDWIAGARSHSLEISINQTIEFLPIILLGADPIIIPIKGLIDGLWGMFIHANIRVSLGKLRYIINGPEFHLWHHANHHEVFHANFSTKFSFWDVIFRTLYESPNQPSSWGLYYKFPKNYFAQHWYAFYRWTFKPREKKQEDL